MNGHTAREHTLPHIDEMIACLSEINGVMNANMRLKTLHVIVLFIIRSRALFLLIFLNYYRVSKLARLWRLFGLLVEGDLSNQVLVAISQHLDYKVQYLQKVLLVLVRVIALLPH